MQEELGPMEDTMASLYDEMILLHQVVSPLIGIQKKEEEVVKLPRITKK